MRGFPIVAAIAALLLLAAPVAASSEVNGGDVVLTHPTATYADLYLEGTDGWTTEDVVDGRIDLTGENRLAPGTWTVVWEGGDTETIVVDYEVVEERPQDPGEADICQWLEPDEYVEGCGVVAQAATQTEPEAEGRVGYLPQTSTEDPEPGEEPWGLLTLIPFVLIWSFRALLARFRVRGT